MQREEEEEIEEEEEESAESNLLKDKVNEHFPERKWPSICFFKA